jgi:hypothetical protein
MVYEINQLKHIKEDPNKRRKETKKQKNITEELKWNC